MIYAYARISKDNDKSVAVEDQCKKIEAFGVATDRVIDEWFIDRDASGRSMKRPGMEKMLSQLKPGDTVIVHKLDRLTRSVKDLGDLLDRKFTIVSVLESLDTNSASGRLIVNILGTVAQWEREVIAERTVASLGYKREQRTAYGSVPYGFKREGNTIIENPLEQLALQRLRALRNSGMGYKGIANILNFEHPHLCRGKEWYPVSVKSILTSRMETATGTNG
jgi:DNA invertase Pin-like site-specific DNA recombinase